MGRCDDIDLSERSLIPDRDDNADLQTKEASVDSMFPQLIPKIFGVKLAATLCHLFLSSLKVCSVATIK
jgi:hypothetical protein